VNSTPALMPLRATAQLLGKKLGFWTDGGRFCGKTSLRRDSHHTLKDAITFELGFQREFGEVESHVGWVDERVANLGARASHRRER
jgi:hypothetical protein